MVRLRKFFNLIKNEYIKIFGRTSTTVMIALIIVAGFALPGLVKLIDSIDSNADYYNTSALYEEYANETLPERKDEYYSADVLKEWDMHQYVIDYKIPASIDWRYQALNTYLDYYDEYADYSECDALAEKYRQENGEGNQFTEEQSAAVSAARKKAEHLGYEALKESAEFKNILSIVESNDIAAYYNLKIDMLEEAKNYPSVLPAHIDAEIEFYEYLRDNKINEFPEGYDQYFALEAYPEYYDANYFSALSIKEAKQAIASYEAGKGVSASEYEMAKATLTLNEYITENNIEYNVNDTVDPMTAIDLDFWSALGMSTSAVSFVGILVIVIAALSVANEFSNGTIKFLLINPVKRWKILVAKYASVITFGYIMILVLYIVSTISSMIFFGGSVIGESCYTIVDGEVKETLGLLYVAKNYLLSSVQVVVMSTLAFAISTLMKSASFSIGISMFGLLSGNIITTVLAGMNIDWGRYLIFSNMDLTAIRDCTTGFAFHTTETAIAVIIIHMIIFWLIAWDAFTKKEI